MTISQETVAGGLEPITKPMSPARTLATEMSHDEVGLLIVGQAGTKVRAARILPLGIGTGTSVEAVLVVAVTITVLNAVLGRAGSALDHAERVVQTVMSIGTTQTGRIAEAIEAGPSHRGRLTVGPEAGEIVASDRLGRAKTKVNLLQGQRSRFGRAPGAAQRNGQEHGQAKEGVELSCQHCNNLERTKSDLT